MKIELHQIPIRELVNGYTNSQEEGVRGYGGKLDIRPKYQREFVYKEQQRDAVITSVRNRFPLNVMYWVKNGGNYEVLDGQQRTISICEYVANKFSVADKRFDNLTGDQQEPILDYELMVYFCEGTDSEKLAWFEIVNIAGAVLTKQELRNAVYTGEWLTDAKGYFSRTGCIAHQISVSYVNGAPIRQELLETAIAWINNGKIEEYMSVHQHDKDANELWQYFQNVITWVKEVFQVYRKEMKGLNWGGFYNCYKNDSFDTDKLEERIKTLMSDRDVNKKSGVYEYVLTGDERCLNIRNFDNNDKREVYERQNGVCPHCKQSFAIDKMEGDHITPWSQGGKTVTENCQMLCKDCNRRKAGN
ncbi:MAG: DUF262 domain-containing protein [Planctomycetaceae bacterium]|nr:DUF262 domain-containing protein [Planctomycetaceae bacterium]